MNRGRRKSLLIGIVMLVVSFPAILTYWTLETLAQRILIPKKTGSRKAPAAALHENDNSPEIADKIDQPRP